MKYPPEREVQRAPWELVGKAPEGGLTYRLYTNKAYIYMTVFQNGNVTSVCVPARFDLNHDYDIGPG